MKTVWCITCEQIVKVFTIDKNKIDMHYYRPYPNTNELLPCLGPFKSLPKTGTSSGTCTTIPLIERRKQNVLHNM